MTHKEYLNLIKEVNRLRNEAHLFNIEEISEAALDDLKHKITQYEAKNPDKISKNSPNYTIAGGVLEKFQKQSHTRRMLSLNDIFDLEELKEWNQRWVNLAEKEEIEIPKKLDYICEPKIDGLAMSIFYENGEVTKAVTRGDGWVGELVTQNIKQIRSIPKKIAFQGTLEVRGEIFFTKSNFQELNKKISNQEIQGRGGKTGDEALFANPRNAASGTVRQLDSSIVNERNLSFIAYSAFIEK